MKCIHIFLPVLLFASCVNGKDRSYTGSTPVGIVIKTFLDIPASDSIDFARWKLVFNDRGYRLQCNYGIGKPNTNGFIDGGKKIRISGTLTREKNIYLLQNGNRILKIMELNEDLLHLLDSDNKLLTGNGGWSYTLNSIAPVNSDRSNIAGGQHNLKDSIAFEGRTPCKVPGIIAAGTQCYKLKWLVILYAGAKAVTGNYRINGTPWYERGGSKGKWEMVAGKNGQVVYHFKDDKGNVFLHLLKASDNILLFTDAEGKLLVGDEDFSYTLNRRW